MNQPVELVPTLRPGAVEVNESAVPTCREVVISVFINDCDGSCERRSLDSYGTSFFHEADSEADSCDLLALSGPQL